LRDRDVEIAVLGGLADVERDLIRTRTAEGRNRAQKRGQHMGRPPRMRRGLMPQPGPASLYFSGEGAAAPEAAWINGTAGHALDYAIAVLDRARRRPSSRPCR
jgi:hypothetical protein